LCLVLLLGCAAGEPVFELAIGQRHLVVEVVDTPETRARGLMHRESLAPDAGMLFVFDEPGIHCFWMKNTLIPLSIAFLDGSRRIINTAEMKPHDLSQVCPAENASFAVEANSGWFNPTDTPPGMRVVFSADIERRLSRRVIR
jgi:hypothetical protein